jgi:predicted HTH transcriptional regulator
MNAKQVIELIKHGETTTVQFKERLEDAHKLSQEMVAFSNTKGGTIVIGVNDKTGKVSGLSFEELNKTNRIIADASTQNVKPAIIVETETVDIDGQIIMLVYVDEGVRRRPFKDKNGAIWLKNGSDKRRAINNEEILRLFQSSGLIYSDEMLIPGSSIEDVNAEYYRKIFEKKYKKSFEDLNISLEQSMINQQLFRDKQLTLAGLLMFCDNREKYRPLFTIQCIAVNAPNLIGNTFDDNEPAFSGNLENVYSQTMKFIERNMKKVPSSDSFNSELRWQIPKEVFEELIVNALVHRDYLLNSSVKVFMLSDRIEIISPGKLPNSQTEYTVSNGVSIPRNPILHSLAQYILPYKGLGTGIARAISIYPDIEIINDTEKEIFKIIIHRLE